MVKWKTSAKRKPLVLRGARQTGKTTLVELLAKEFETFVPLNLEIYQDRRLWENEAAVEQIVRNIEIAKNIKIVPGKTLLFLDEIQNEPRAIQSLRYFHEKMPGLHVIATGSLMEVSLKKKGLSFPVGRVTFMYLYPFSFDEYLRALSHTELLGELQTLRIGSKISASIHSLASEKFREFLFVGGMPEAVKVFSEQKNYIELLPVHEGLLNSFEEDVPKYARPPQIPYLQFLIQQAPLFAGQKIQYANFADSGYQGREMKTAFDTLEKAMIIQRVPGSPHVDPPQQANFRMQPKLLYLDVGLVCRKLKVEPESLQRSELNGLFRGSIAEQVVGQELLARSPFQREVPSFWYRNQPGSVAESDYCIPMREKLIPIEVKSGKAGKLKSLHQFMDAAPHDLAVRIYSGPLMRETAKTPRGKKFQLLSIPFYLMFRIKEMIE